MCALLKQKSKIITVPKKRKTYEAFDFQKRHRDQMLSQSLSQAQTQATQSSQAQTQERKKIVPQDLGKGDAKMREEKK